MAQDVLFEVLGPIARLTLNRPLSLSQTLSRLAVDRESDDDRVQ